MKKIFCLILCAFSLFVTVPFSSSAKNGDETVAESFYEFDYYNAPSYPYSAARKSYDEILEGMVRAAKNLEDGFELTKYKIYQKDLNSLLDAFYVYEPDLFYLSPRFSYSYDRNTKQILKLNFEYLYPKNEIIAKRAEYDGFIKDLVQMKSPNWTDYETLLFYHDYLVVNFQYDFTYSIYDVYNLYKTGTGVCQAYANLYRDILDELGFETVFVANDKINHGWAGVKLDGEWYCVDPTWSDNIIDGHFYGHNNFLFSEKNAGEHIVDAPSEWLIFKEGVSFKSTLYDNTLWEDVNSAFVYLNDKWYFVGGNYLEGYFIYSTEDFKNRTPVFELPETNWTSADGMQYYADCFFCISLYNENLVVTTSQSVIVYNPLSNKVLVENPLDVDAGYQIFGSKINDNILYYTLYKDISTENLEDIIHKTFDLRKLDLGLPKGIEKVEIESLPEKLTYYCGESFSLEGLSLKVLYTDGTFEIVTSDIEIKDFNSNIPTKITVKAVYKGFEVPFEVEIVKREKPQVGDVDGDGSINLNDAMSIVLKVAKKDNTLIPEEEFVYWDIDRNGNISLNDAMYIILYVAKKSDHVGP